MGDTKVKLSRSIWLTRWILAGLVLLIGFIALLYLLIFPNITIRFETGVDAQPISDMQIKKGSSVPLPTPLKPGSYFVGWSLQKNGTELLTDSSQITINGTKLYAVWDGIEKYGVLAVNGIPYRDINIFDTSDVGLTPAELNQNWRLLDDYAEDNPNLTDFDNQGLKIDVSNNYSRFLGWRYLNADNQYNDLLFNNGNWMWIKRDLHGEVSATVEITDENKFFPPNYRTTFNAILQYRKICFMFYPPDDNNPYYKPNPAQTDQTQMQQYMYIDAVDADAVGVVIPAYDVSNPSQQFSHWQIEVNDNTNATNVPVAYLTNAMRERIATTSFAAGETVDMQPLWYYLSNQLQLVKANVDSADKEVKAVIKMRAVNWTDHQVDQYTMQLNTETGAKPACPIGHGTYDDLSLSQPVIYDDSGDKPALRLFLNQEIASYSFYDHKGVYHEIFTSNLNDSLKITLGGNTIIGDKTAYLNADWAVHITVNYQSYNNDIALYFDFGSELYALPTYQFNRHNVVSQAFYANVGHEFTLLGAEKYLKTDYLFYGWQIKGDPTETVYTAGSNFIVPLVSAQNGATIEFEAVWRLSRLLFNFDFAGGDDWETTPNFRIMKGAYNDLVQIVYEKPIRFGYDFLGWTLDDGTELLQPGDKIRIGTELQTLHAQWRTKKLRVIFYVKTTANTGAQLEQWQPEYLDNANAIAELYRVEDRLELPKRTDNTYYRFHGWRIGDQILNPSQPNQKFITLTAELIKGLNDDWEYNSSLDCLDISIYAEQERMFTEIRYDFSELDNFEVDQTGWTTVLIQGTTFSGDPFIRAAQELDMHGRVFAGWEYAKVKRIGNQDVIETVREKIVLGETTVPDGIISIVVYPTWAGEKTYTIRYYDSIDNRLIHEDVRQYTYSGTPILINGSDYNLIDDPTWGTFIGWSFEQDYRAGNPEIIYNVLDHPNTALRLWHNDNATYAADTKSYDINIDRHDQKIDGLQYVLKLYSVYAKDFITTTYRYYNNYETVLTCPVYVDQDYTQSVMGGKTVAPEHADFAERGLAVLDGSEFEPINNQSFVGWQVLKTELAGVRQAMVQTLTNKIWLPGEYLPSLDFDVVFHAVFVNYGVSSITMGDTTYRVWALSPESLNQMQSIVDIDIVVLPNADYTVKMGQIKITNSRVVNVVVPADRQHVITLEPMAIQCDQIVTFYLADNVEITANPVVGANFQAYHVKKGYFTYDRDSKQISDLQDPTTKYNFAASIHGILVQNQTLLGVPSHTTVTNLQEVLDQFQINHVAGYALVDLNSLDTIDLNLAAENLQLDASAIFGSNARTIILPLNSAAVSADCLAGVHNRLWYVKFGNEYASNYAFTDLDVNQEPNGYVYYDPSGTRQKTYLMYVLQNVQTTGLNRYLPNFRNLRLDDAVEKISPYAFAGCNWERVDCITAFNPVIDLREIQGLSDKNIPIFVDRNNRNSNGLIQAYEKHLIFSCTGYDNQTLSYVYGQNFVVFDPKENNPHGFQFDRPWSRFLGWRQDGISNLLFTPNESYQIGVNPNMVGDGYDIRFDASTNASWQAYTVQFHVYDGIVDTEYQPTALFDLTGNTHTMDELVGNAGQALRSRLYLPGMDTWFTDANNVKYQFIGWTTDEPHTFSDHIWSNTNKSVRILPNKTPDAMLNKGTNFYALYDRVSDNLAFTLSNGTYTVRNNNKAQYTSIYIPFAKYNNGYMVPVTRVADQGFNALPNVTEIMIGGAIQEIGKSAFEGLNATVTFLHQGAFIEYNGNAAAQLVIGKSAFSNNTSITSIVLPASLTEIGERAFAFCTKLNNVTFEGGVTAMSIKSIGDLAFSNDTALSHAEMLTTYITNPEYGKNIFSLGAGIFRSTAVKVQGTNKITWGDRLLHVYEDDNNDGKLEITEKYILGYAFAGINGANSANRKITSIHITNPDAIISANAFSMLHSDVTEINLVHVNPKNVNVDAFAAIPLDHSINVVVASGNSGWNDLKLPSNIHLQ